MVSTRAFWCLNPGRVLRRSMKVGSLARLAAFGAATWVLMAAVWLLLVDNPALPELVAGAVAAAVAATGSELVRAQRIARVRPRVRWLRFAWRPFVRLPLDVLLVMREVARQAAQRKPRRGELRAVRFEHRSGGAQENARRALAEALGSVAPNTIVIGVDEERELLLAHQLVPAGDERTLDPLELR